MQERIRRPTAAQEMDVILDFLFEKGFFFISIKNVSAKPVFKLSIKFDKGFTGHGGATKIHALSIFKSIEFLAPGKEIRFYMDASHAYFARQQPTELTATINYATAESSRNTYKIKHNLGIYADLVYLVSPLPLKDG